MKVLFILIKNLLYSLKGYFLWKKMKHQFNCQNDMVWLFTDEELYAKWGIEYLQDYLYSNLNEKVNIVITPEMYGKICSNQNIKLVDNIYYITQKQYKYMENFYNLYGEKLKWILVSCDKPEGRNIKNYMFDSQVELRELFKVGVLGILEFNEVNT